MDINAAGSSAAGATRDQLREIGRFAVSPYFTESERLVLTFADHLTATPADVPDHVYGAIVKLWGEAGAVELASAIAWENYRARFNRAFKVQSEGFCPVPLPGT
jgi:alkylhydroperoxidase family enzyme